mgnify:CR=1 FL=1
MKTLYLMKEKEEEIKKFAGIVCGENILVKPILILNL